MGLDSIELLIEVEKAFKITIPDREAEKIITVKDFYDVVWDHVSHRQSNLCKTQHIFYLLRNHFEKEWGVSKTQFKLSVPVNELVPALHRRELYYAMDLSICLRLPALVLGNGLSRILDLFGFFTIAGSFIVVAVGINFYEWSKWCWFTILVGIGLTMLLSHALEFKRVMIPNHTIRKFVETVFALNYTSQEQNAGINRHEVELVVKQIILDKIGVDESEIIPSARLCDDLGVD